MKIHQFVSLAFSILLATASINVQANPCELSPSIQDGIGGTGNSTDGGIGGTGQKLLKGIGGTGQKLAIVGVVTGFASICVNGEEVHFEDKTTVTVNGEPSNTSNMAVGQVVSITADKTPKGWTASSISTNDAVSGPVTKFTAPNRVVIAGQTVNLPRELANGAGKEKLSVGQNVRVQGIRLSNGEILATSAAPTNTREIVISGPVQKFGNGSVGIGGVKVVNLVSDMAVAGQNISVTGRMAGSTLLATNARHALQIDTNAQQLSIQSVVISSQAGRIQLNNNTIVNVTQNFKPGNLVRIFAVKDENGNWQGTEIINQSHDDLMRRAGERQNNSGKRSNSDDSGKDDKIEANDDNSNSDSGSNSGSDSNSSSDSNSGSGSRNRSVILDNSSVSDRPTAVDRPSGGDRPTTTDRNSGGDRIRTDRSSGGDRIRNEINSSSGSGRR